MGDFVLLRRGGRVSVFWKGIGERGTNNGGGRDDILGVEKKL